MMTGRDNPAVKDFRHLLTDAKFRRETGRFALEGARLCEEAALSGLTVLTAFYTARGALAYPVQWEAVARAAERCVEVSDALAAFMAETQTPQGLFCVCAVLDNPFNLDTIEKTGAYIACENLQDPGNMGAVFRTAEAFGIRGLFLSAGCCDVYNPKVLRAGMGGTFRLPFWQTPDMPHTLLALQERGFTAAACVVAEDAVPLHRLPFPPGSIGVIGNEGNGLSFDTIAACRLRVTIPMAGRAQSLNAAMAAGILIWEMAKN